MVFLKRAATEQALPCDLKAQNATTVAAMTEARSIERARFAHAQDLFDDLEASGK